MKKLLTTLCCLAGLAAFADTTFTLDADYTGEIVIDQDYTIELNGHTISGQVIITNGNTVVIQDSVGGGTIHQARAAGHPGAIILQDGNLTIKSGTIICDSGTAAINMTYSRKHPKLTVEGGTIKATSTGTQAAAIFAGANTTDNAEVTISDGTLIGQIGVSLSGRNVFKMTGGTIATKVSDKLLTVHGIYVGLGDEVTLSVTGGLIGGSQNAVVRSSKDMVGFVQGKKLTAGFYQSCPQTFAIANGYTANDESGNADYPWQLVKEETYQEDVTLDDPEEGEVDTVVYIPESYYDKMDEAGIEDVNEVVNGTKVWQKALLGLDPDATLVAVDLYNESKTKATVTLHHVSAIEDPEGFTLTYQLENKGSVIDTNPDEPKFTVDISDLSAACPTNEWTINVKFTAEDGTETIVAANQVGATRVDSDAKSVILAVPYQGISNKGELTDIKVSELVDEATLTDGDTLNVYDQDSGTYSSWELTRGAWTAVTGVSAAGTTTPEADMTVPRGSSVWLNRQSAADPIYLLGQVVTDGGSVTATKGTTDAPVSTLMAAPSAEPTEITATTKDAANDEIVIPGANDTFTHYVQVDGKWGYYSVNNKGKTVFTEVDDVTVGAGTGYWYISKGGTSTLNY